MRTGIASLIALFLLASPSLSRTWQIQPNGSGDAPTIQAGIDSAAVGDTVMLYDGTYTGAENKNLDFGGKDLVLTSVNGPETTVIDCQGSGRGIHLHSGETEASRIERVTITRGHRLTGEGPYGGGGIRIEDCDPTIFNCVVTDCDGDSLSGNGGAICFIGDTPALVESCAILGNKAKYGGGIAWPVFLGSNRTPEIRGCRIAGNWAVSGGGTYGHSDLILYDCLITGNYAEERGGGVYNHRGSQGTTDHCTFSGNRAGISGGGMQISASDHDYHWIQFSIFHGNDAPSGADVYEGEMNLTVMCCDIDAANVAMGGGTVEFWVSFPEDPLFCDPRDPLDSPTIEGDFSLDAASPCLPGNHPDSIDCGLIGAFGPGCDVYTSVADAGSIPARAFGIFASPNPSTGDVSIRFSLPSNSPVPIQIYDIRGRVVRSLEANGVAGVLTWDGRSDSGENVAPGVYFVRIEEGTESRTSRVTVIR